MHNLLNNVADAMLHCADTAYFVWPFDKDVICPIYYECSPPIPRVICPWLLTVHLWLNLYSTRFSQDLHMCPGLLLVGRSQTKSTRQRVLKKSILEWSMYVMYATTPAHLQDACPWLLTGDLPLDLYHARLRQNPHMDHSPSSGQQM